MAYDEQEKELMFALQKLVTSFSNYDPPFFTYGIQKPVNFIAASDQEVEWWLIWAPFLYGWIPVDRKKLAPSTIKRALGVLKKKRNTWNISRWRC